ncbi:hypothetical protein [Kitasatospora sp. NPDC088548]|uniref:hypothetical protein n=1 Tax=Kitasatospora sp. NPDC088548 TaxID=3364075 RepID=UPI003817A767
MNDAVVNGLIAGGLGLFGALLGVFLGARLTRRQQRETDARDEVRRLREGMQQLVVAASELAIARKTHHAQWLSPQTRLRTVGMAGIEFWSAFRSAGGGWRGVARGYAPAARVVDEWNRGSLREAAALAPFMARVAAAGLPLGMSGDPAVAQAAKAVMDAAFEDRGEAALNDAVAALRAALYPPHEPPVRWYRKLTRRVQEPVPAPALTTSGPTTPPPVTR